MNRLCFLVLLLCLCVCAEKALPLPTINIWSGREQCLPLAAVEGWRVEADHGRMLAQERTAGPVRLSFPTLTGKETALLFVDGQMAARLVIHPEKLLDGIAADCLLHRPELERLGVRNLPSDAEAIPCFFLPMVSLDEALGIPHSAAAKFIVFTEQRDFPLDIREEWQEVTVGLDRNKGTFSVILEQRERIIDNAGGGGAWVVARSRKGETFLLLPPEFDLQDVNNILFLKKELEK